MGDQRQNLPDDPDPERDESPAERLDRNWSELLQELRVTQTGIQILSGFLLTLPFQSRFAELEPALLGIFLAAVVLGTLTPGLIVAPVTAHRLLFRRHAKDVLVLAGNRLAKAGLGLLALTVVMVVALVFGFVLDLAAGLVAGGIALAVFVVLWLAVPLRLAAGKDKAAGPYT